jgi:putative membrane protein
MKKYFPHLLLSIYIIEFIICAINPYSRAVWYVENGPIVALVGIITFLYYKKVRFSNLTYLLMFVLPFWHTIGGHYTFERVPFQWFSDLFGFERNMFDRIGHFSVGFYALPIMEYVYSRGIIKTKLVTVLYGVFAIAFVAMSYELVEWIYAATAGGAEGAAFLGSQGDIWDAQKDMLMDTLGAVVVALVWLMRKKVYTRWYDNIFRFGRNNR